jgi:hypothetical protein
VTTRLRSVLAAFVLVMLGCAGEPAVSPAPRSYFVPPAYACPAVNPLVPIPRPAPLAAGFHPVTAALCTFTPVILSSAEGLSGGWVWRDVRRSDGPSFDVLQRALRTAPLPRLGDRICTPRNPSMIYLALTDAQGRTVVPAIPLDGCGTPLAVVGSAIAGMTWRTIDSR